jgi:hypothetical protein
MTETLVGILTTLVAGGGVAVPIGIRKFIAKLKLERQYRAVAEAEAEQAKHKLDWHIALQGSLMGYITMAEQVHPPLSSLQKLLYVKRNVAQLAKKLGIDYDEAEVELEIQKQVDFTKLVNNGGTHGIEAALQKIMELLISNGGSQRNKEVAI